MPSLVDTGYANGLPRLVVPRIVPPRRRMPVTSFGTKHARAAGLDEAVETVFDAQHFDAAVARGLDDRADDGVQPRCVSAAGEDADAPDLWHGEKGPQVTSVL